MLTLIVLLMALFPLSVFAESPTVSQPTIVVIPDGHGSVQYRRMPHGLDPLTALTIGDGLSQIGARHVERTPSGGAIPSNLLTHGNNDSNGYYLEFCKRSGLKPHPAQFPIQIPAFFIRFLTDPTDLVLDPFAGEQYNRRSL
jgi:DNA methylase